MLCLFLFVTQLVSLLSTVHGSVEHLTVCPSNSLESCNGTYDINQALERVITGTQIILEPGEHLLSTFVLLQNVTDISIVGQHPNHSEVIVRCVQPNTGLSFFDVRNLSLNNFTIVGCGVSNENLVEILEFVQDRYETLHTILSDLQIALFIGESQDVSISNLRVRDTVGIGLFGMNINGELTDSVFENSHPKEQMFMSQLEMVTNHSSFVGGGVYVLYQDYHDNNVSFLGRQNLMLSNCLFLNNTDFSSASETEIFYQYSPFLQERGYVVGGSGGLTVILSQIHFSVNVEIMSSKFQRNVAMFGGGAHVSIFSRVTDSSVTFSECQFIENGKVEEFHNTGGLSVFIDVCPEQSLPVTDSRNISILIMDTVFRNNAGQSTGALSVISLYAQSIADNSVQVKFQQCRFERNIASKVAALSISEQKYISLNDGVQIEIEDCIFMENAIQNTQFPSLVDNAASTVTIQNMNVTLLGRIVFQRNFATALVGVRSSFNIHGNVIFSNNIGILGAAIRLLSLSTLILKHNSAISMLNNFAISGGGLFVSFLGDEFLLFNDHCFIHADQIQFLSDGTQIRKVPQDFNVTVTFRGNQATTGSMIYGTDMKSCPWARNVRSIEPNFTLLQNIYHNPENQFLFFDKEPIGSKRVSTASETIVVDSSISKPVMPGRTFQVPIVAYDAFQQSVPEILSLAVLLPNRSFALDSTIGDSGFWFLDGTPEGSNTPLTLVGAENETLDIVIGSTIPGSSAVSRFTIKLTHCLVGYLYNETSRSCYCDPRLMEFDIECDLEEQTFTVPMSKWLGPLEVEVSENISNNLLVSGSCPLDFCKPGTKIVRDENFQSQCQERSGRTGVLCGACKEGFSLTLGLTCRDCSNYHLFVIIPILLVGVLPVILLVFFQISISEGYLNSVLFYCNFATFNSIVLLPYRPEGPYLFGIAGLLSFFPSFNICLFDGMDAFSLTLVEYGFILYSLSIVGFVVLIAKFVTLPGAHNYSPVKVLATLLLLCYTVLTETSFLSLAFVNVRTLDGEAHWRWLLDPSQPYFQGRHIALGIIAIVVILGYVIPLPLLTLFPTLVNKNKYLVQFKPLHDAIWAPFKLKYRWYFGYRLIVRILFVLLSTLLTAPYNLFALSVLLAFVHFLHQALAPFQNNRNNLFENFLMTNLILLVIGALFFYSAGNKSQHVIYTSITVSVAYLAILVLLLKHVYIRFQDKFDHVKIFFLQKIKRKKKHKPNSDKPNDEETTTTKVTVGDGRELNVWQKDRTLPGYTSPNTDLTVSFTEFREPLLEDSGEVEVATTAVCFHEKGRLKAASVEHLNTPDNGGAKSKESNGVQQTTTV